MWPRLRVAVRDLSEIEDFCSTERLGLMQFNGDDSAPRYPVFLLPSRAMKQRIKIVFAGGLLALALFGVVAAGPLEDGKAAYQSGDDATAVRLLRPLADLGNADAQNNLGAIYYSGHGVPQDYAQAVAWYRRAADQGDAPAQAALGWMYEEGQGVTQDYAQAAIWYRKAADQGNAEAQGNLGAMYYSGHGVPQDSAKAAEWYRRAADQGNIAAQYNLSVAYFNGWGVTRDYAQAVKWFQKAADQDYTDAQTALGMMYAQGAGIPQDYVQAYMWFNLAALRAASGDRRDMAAKNRDEVAAKMTPAQIAEAQKLAREWTPKAGLQPPN
jgi:uncharacterized protein